LQGLKAFPANNRQWRWAPSAAAAAKSGEAHTALIPEWEQQQQRWQQI